MIWPGSQQTMGELLDQDKLTCKMLRQAFAKAENEQVRKAAEVLLVDRERKIREYIDGGNLPRNIDEAVAVKVADNGGWATIRELWYRHNGCMDWNRLHSLMGETQNAQIRSACVILLGYHYQVEHQKILDGKGPLLVTSPKSSYLLRKTERYLIREGLVIGAALGLCVAYLLWYAYKAFFVYDYSSLADLNWLAWVIIALVSPWGVFAIEVKNRSGTFEYSGLDFYEKRKSGYEKVADDSNPIKQARRNAAALKEFLDPDFNRNKEHAFVEPIVVWANPEIKVYRKKPADSQDPHSQETKCWRIEDLSFELDSIRCKKHLSEKAQREIIKKLESCY